MKHTTLKAISLSLLMLCLFMSVSIVTIWQAFTPLSVSSLRTSTGVIEENGKGLYLHTGDIRSPLVKVSPFDDYVYHTDGTKVHIFDNYHFNDTGTVHSFSDAFSFYIHQLTFPTNTFTWTITGPDGTVRYMATWRDSLVTIERTVLEPQQPITAYGNSIVVCATCFITSSTSAYFTGVYSTNEKVLESITNAFTPVLITDALPLNVKNVTVRMNNGQPFITEKGDMGIRYEEPWHLIEVKSKTPKQVMTLSL
jgi:hypothetical protein